MLTEVVGALAAVAGAPLLLLRALVAAVLAAAGVGGTVRQPIGRAVPRPGGARLLARARLARVVTRPALLSLEEEDVAVPDHAVDVGAAVGRLIGALRADHVEDVRDGPTPQRPV